MTNEIHNKINKLFSEEITHDKFLILSPGNKSIKKKKKVKEKSSNILAKVEKSIELNKEEKVKSKKRKSSRIKKRVVNELCQNELEPKVSNEEIKNNKKLRDLRTTLMLNLKKKQKDKDKDQKKEISEESNESDYTDSNENCENVDEDKKKRKIM